MFWYLWVPGIDKTCLLYTFIRNKIIRNILKEKEQSNSFGVVSAYLPDHTPGTNVEGGALWEEDLERVQER